jgi:hypothetical protein
MQRVISTEVEITEDAAILHFHLVDGREIALRFPHTPVEGEPDLPGGDDVLGDGAKRIQAVLQAKYGTRIADGFLSMLEFEDMYISSYFTEAGILKRAQLIADVEEWLPDYEGGATP